MGIKDLLKIKKMPLWGIFAYTELELLSIIIFFISYKKKVSISKKIFNIPFFILTGIFFYSFISCLILNYDINKLIQQYLYISLFILCYSLFFSFWGKKLNILFANLMKVSYYVSLLGIIQIVIYYVTNFDIFGILTWLPSSPTIAPKIIRVHSICPEAGQLGTLLCPSIIYFFYYNDPWKLLHRKKYIILLTALLTTSLTVYIAIICSLYFKFISKKKYIDYIAIILLSLGGFNILLGSIKNIDITSTDESGINGVLIRLQDTSNLLFNLNDLSSIEKTNTSTYAWAANFYVARHAPNRITGTGLGTHKQNYHKVYSSSNRDEYGLNDDEGYSLLNRIYSEFGIIGLLSYIYLVMRKMNRKNMISFSLFFYLLGSFFRGGNYMAAGIIFYHFFFFLSKGQENKRIHTLQN